MFNSQRFIDDFPFYGRLDTRSQMCVRPKGLLFQYSFGRPDDLLVLDLGIWDDLLGDSGVRLR